jgi:AAA15 family ATPase/GTPase
MITKLSVSNFKSVRQLDIDCKKVNLFIGEPNTGKSNILEALGLLSWCGRAEQPSLGDFVRFELTRDLFYDKLVDQTVKIEISTKEISPTGIRIMFDGDSYGFYGRKSNSPFRSLDEDGHYNKSTTFGPVREIRFFRFKSLARYDDKEAGSLKSPHGSNLFSVVATSTTLRKIMDEFFQKYGLKLFLRDSERVFEVIKAAEGPMISYSYILTSETLRRIIFYTVAMTSNKDSVLVFEEPESNAFPYYTKYLGERIALDKTNQFFIATHNPYLLSAIIEKARMEGVQVFITYFKDFQTQVKPLTTNQLSELMEADPFFNLDRFIEGE